MMTLDKLKQRNADDAALTYEWRTLMPGAEIPDSFQFILWTELHSTETMLVAIRKTARKRRTLGRPMKLDHMIRYASKCANSLEAPRIERHNDIVAHEHANRAAS